MKTPQSLKKGQRLIALDSVGEYLTEGRQYTVEEFDGIYVDTRDDTQQRHLWHVKHFKLEKK